MKKKINSSILSQIAGIGSASKSLEEIGDRQIFSEEKLLNFSFNVDRVLIDFIRKFVDYKRYKLNDYHYSQTDAIREGIFLLKEVHTEIEKRPSFAKIPTRKGRTSGVSIKMMNKVEKVKSSFSINEVEKEFIYDFIYHKIKSNVNFLDQNDQDDVEEFFKRNTYGKEDFFKEIVQILSQKYKLKV